MLWVFVIVLGHSRALWAELVVDLTADSLCPSLVGAAAYGGAPSRVRPTRTSTSPEVVTMRRGL
jgi:hypothetical protein